MHIVALGWMFVVVLMSLAEATSPEGTLLGAGFTLLLYGLAPLAVVLYVMNTPHRRRARQRSEAEAAENDADAAATPGERGAEGAEPGGSSEGGGRQA